MFVYGQGWSFRINKRTKPGLQITVGHRPLADQNLLMSDEIPNVVGHDVRTNFFYRKSFYGNDEEKSAVSKSDNLS